MADDPKPCNNCRTNPAGDGGVLCVDCRDRIAEHAQDPYGEWFEAARTAGN